MQSLQDQVSTEQVRLIYRQAPLVLIGSFLAAVVMVVLLWDNVPQQYLVWWSVLFIIIAVARGVLSIAYWRFSKRPSKRTLPWGVMFCIGAGIAGSWWGAAAVKFYLPDQPQYILFLTCLYTGLIAACGAGSGAYMPAFFYFSIPATVPFAIRHLMDGREIFTAMGLLFIFFLFVCGIFVRTYHKNTDLLIRTQITNELLLDQVKEEKQAAENSQHIAEKAVTEKNRFLAAASHDLRQPLHALGLFVGALRRETSPSQSQLVERIEDSVAALSHLFNGLLDVSRLDAGVVPVVKKHFNLNAVLQRLHTEYLPLALAKNLELKIHGSDIVVHTDQVLLERILRNLMANAINYTDHGKVTVSYELIDEIVEIKINDTGIGIPATETEAIFSEYYQLNNPERDRNKGLGLGLAIVRRLSKLLNIPVTMDSVHGQGTTFSLRIMAGDSRFIDTKKPLPDHANMENMSILVIDDEKSVLTGMESILTAWGTQVLLAESAVEAIKLIGTRSFVPDIIFSDYRLRDNQTGVDAIYAVREELNSEIPAVLITGDTSPERLQEATGSGFHLLHKPVTPEAIYQVLVSIKC